MICSVTNFQPRERAFLFHPTILRIEFPGQEIPGHDIDGAESSTPVLAPSPGNRVRRDFLWLQWVRVREQAGRLAMLVLCLRSTCSSPWFDISHFLLLRCLINVQRETPTKQTLWTTGTTSFEAFRLLMFVHNSSNLLPLHLSHVGYRKHFSY
jgi:hypothetical protein